MIGKQRSVNKHSHVLSISAVGRNSEISPGGGEGNSVSV